MAGSKVIAVAIVLMVAVTVEYVASVPQSKFKVSDYANNIVDAIEKCARFNMTLATIETSEDHDQAIAAIESDQRHLSSYYFTAGVYQNDVWMWITKRKPIGWFGSSDASEQCLVLDLDEDHLFYKAKDCEYRRPALCQELSPVEDDNERDVGRLNRSIEQSAEPADRNAYRNHPLIQIFSGAQVTININ